MSETAASALPTARYSVEWTLADGTRETTTLRAESNYLARTYALVEQDERNAAAQTGDQSRRVVSARIRTGGFMFAGPWFDLNEEG